MPLALLIAYAVVTYLVWAWPVVATPKQFDRIQWAFVGLLLTSGVAIFLFAHQL